MGKSPGWGRRVFFQVAAAAGLVAAALAQISLHMASGWATHPGGLGVYVGTTDPGAIHLMNDLRCSL